MEQIPLSRTIGAGPLMKTLLKLLERDGTALLRPFCQPYYRTMSSTSRPNKEFRPQRSEAV